MHWLCVELLRLQPRFIHSEFYKMKRSFKTTSPIIRKLDFWEYQLVESPLENYKLRFFQEFINNN